MSRVWSVCVRGGLCESCCIACFVWFLAWLLCCVDAAPVHFVSSFTFRFRCCAAVGCAKRPKHDATKEWLAKLRMASYLIRRAAPSEREAVRDFEIKHHLESSAYSPESEAAQIADIPTDFPEFFRWEPADASV